MLEVLEGIQQDFNTGSSARKVSLADLVVLGGVAPSRRRRPMRGMTSGSTVSPAVALVEKVDTLKLTVPEMTVLVAGLRVLDANAGGVDHGVFTARPGTLSNDFFVNLLDMGVVWTKSADGESVFEARDRASGELK